MKITAIRDERGRILPGTVLNPAGGNKNVTEVTTLAKTFTTLAVSTLAEIAANRKAPAAARVTAAEALLNRAWGKAPVSADLTVRGVPDLGQQHLEALKALAAVHNAKPVLDTTASTVWSDGGGS